MNLITATAIGDCAREGRDAFRTHGVTGRTSHNYPDGSVQKVGFMNGFSEEHHHACERALDEAHAYHALTVRETAKDRAWAERLFAATNA